MISAERANRYTWQPTDLVVDAPNENDELDHVAAALEALLAEIHAETEERFDDFSHGYNPYRAGDGKFAPGAHHDRKAARVERAQVNADRAEAHLNDIAGRRTKAETAHREAVVAAKSARAEAKSAGAKAKREPTAANIAAWHSATQGAIRARSAAQRHASAAARHADLHDKAEVTHALAQAKLREAHRAATAAPHEAPRAVEATGHVIGVERIRGGPEHATPSHRSPHETAHASREHHEPAPPHKETVLEMLERTRPHYVHVPQERKPSTPDELAERDRQRQIDAQRARDRGEAKVREHRAAAQRSLATDPRIAAVSLPGAGDPLHGVPGAAAISLPMPHPRLDRADDSDAVLDALLLEDFVGDDGE